MAIRGHKEEEGNLVQLMNLWSEDVPGLKRWLDKHQYMSHQVVNEMITLMGNTVLHKLLSNIREACWFTIIADEKVTFVTMNNLLLLFVGLAAHNDIHEYLDTSTTLTVAIKDILIRCILPLNNGQG